MDSLFVVMPVYNEQENIKKVIEEWYTIVEQYNGGGTSRLILIDDGSTDDTYKIMTECATSRPFVELVKKANSGHGATVLYGYNYAIEHGADYIFQTDSDGQTLPADFHVFWNEREDWDMLIGWRKNRQDGLSRIVVSKILKLVLKICFGVNVKDANTPFRLMKTKMLRKYIGYIPKDYYLSNVLLSVIYAKKKCITRYIPITFRARQGGINSINIQKIFVVGKKAVGDFRRINREWQYKNI